MAEPVSDARWRFCIHEAGHCVIALLEDVPVDYVRTSNLQAATALADREAGMKKNPETMLRFGHAGALAVVRRFGGHADAELSPQDRGIIEEAKRRIGLREPQWEATLTRDVDSTLRDRWDDLEALATYICSQTAKDEIRWDDIKTEWQRIQDAKRGDAAPDTAP